MESYLPTPPAEGLVTSKTATVYIPDPFHPRAEVIAEQSFGRVLRGDGGGKGREWCLSECDGILLRIGTITPTDLDHAPRLRLIARNGTGVDTVPLEACLEKKIGVTNYPGGNAPAVAELCLTLALSVLRRIKEMDHRIRSNEIVPSITALSSTLFNKKIGLIGMGDIAYEFSKLLQPFNPTILVYSPTSPSDRWVSPNPRYPVPIPHRRVDLETLLKECDVLSIHCPLTPKTRYMISTDQLGMMKSHAVLVNTSRGAVVDEKALAEALVQGQIGGAGLDVFEIEPPHGETLGALRDMLNVVCLPHLGGSTDESAFEGCRFAVENMVNYLDGRGVKNRVV